MKSINIYDFFPIKDDATLEKFLKQDSEYEDRKNQFSDVILKANLDTPQKFIGSVVPLVFEQNYVAGHRWPTVK